MKFLFRWAFRLFIVLVVLVVAAVLLKDTLLKSWTEHRVRAQTGMDMTIGRFEVGLFSPTLTMEDVRVYNPAEFGGSPFLIVPDLHLECDSRALVRRKLRFKLARLSVTEMNVVESRTGQTNLLQALDTLQRAASTSVPDVGNLFGLEFGGIETLNLSLGKVRFTSLKQASKATEVQLALKDEVLTNVRSAADLTNLVMKVLFRNGITIVTDTPQAKPKASLEGASGGRTRRR
jgi:hypothetical protein